MKHKAILLLSNRALDFSHGARNLIEQRALALWKRYKIKTIIINVTKRRRVKGRSFIDNNAVEIENFFYENTPFSIVKALINARKKAVDILKNTDIISIGWTGWWIYVLRIPFKGPTFIDIHGTQKELIDFSKPSIKIKVQYWIRISLEKFGASKTKVGLFVTDELAQSTPSLRKLKRFIIPCGIEFISSDKVKLLRSKWRRKFEYRDNDIVIVYSGSNSKWQCLKESLILWKRLREKGIDKNLSFKLLVLKAGEWNLSDYDKTLSNEDVVEISLNPDEAKEALTAGDFGLILRKDIPTNNVAFPNKFSEYLNANLIPIITPAIKDPNKYLLRYKVPYVNVPQFEVEEQIFTDETIENIMHAAISRSKNYMIHLEKTRKVSESLKMENLIEDFAHWLNKTEKD